MAYKFTITTALMGYGHLRAAHTIAAYSGMPVIWMGKTEHLGIIERGLLRISQWLYHTTSRKAEQRDGLLFRGLENVLDFPDNPAACNTALPSFTRALIRAGIGKKMYNGVDGDKRTLLHTFYLPALISLYHNYPVKNYLLVCDTDCHRIWVPVDAHDSRLHYCVPAAPAADRLMTYGVPPGKITLTGFPLPIIERREYQNRLERLAPESNEPLTIAFPFSGASVYFNYFARILKSLANDLYHGEIRLTVFVGDNPVLYKKVVHQLKKHRLFNNKNVEVLYHANIMEAFSRFNASLEHTDIIITKPGELVFYAALGIPLLFLPPIGKHEYINRDYIVNNDAGMDIAMKDFSSAWIEHNRRNGTWHELATHGYHNLPRNGTTRMCEIIRECE